jgi:hypothetical protein
VGRRLGLTLAVAALALVAPIGYAVASTQPASGTFVEGPETIIEEGQSGGNLIIELTRDVVFTGTYSGTGEAHQRIVIHQDGQANVNMTISFTGLACGQPSELTFLVVGQVQFDETFNGPIAGTYTVIGSGGSDARGHGEFAGSAGVGGAYEGAVHCD